MNIDVVQTIIYSSMVGVTVLALVDVLSKEKQKPSVFLSGLLLLLLLNVLGELFFYSGAYQYAPALVGAQLPVRMLLGPALYLYAYACMSPNSAPSRRTYLIALTGPVLAILPMLPFVFGLSSAEKLALADPLTRNPEHYKFALFMCVGTMLVFVVFTGGYLAATLQLHRRHCLQLMDKFSSIERQSMAWFKVVLILWGLAWFMYSVEYVMVFFGWRWFGTGIVLPLFEAVVLIAFAHLALKQAVLDDSEKGKPNESETRATTLSEQKMAQISAKLKKVMFEDQMFMDEELSLNKLSNAIGISENHISETLSQHLQMNFFHFVNSYRIELAKTLLLTTDKLVSTIVYEVGFNSKSTFNTAFKKQTNLTPSAFKKQEKLVEHEKITN
ncbi:MULTISPECIES: helix-turn-helix domain-containing protein [Pseudoalteromonas]|uniref:AraC family transcriptional regulator n=1 Tax=Pseudoalteromonas amylolytica TaxID=1859457 RepID=A0A1S1MU38_9GAMM|nr:MULTISPECIES: helix-turn-helix transcriptional regulator [Pseudoalteromonas]OHU84905.1 AraC family transcriptional regulator [Pseudoalteromonas sp. JW3]OHU90144.1 AraC family transcriptional regulator [Pseudoalteromonas amylolytica]